MPPRTFLQIVQARGHGKDADFWRCDKPHAIKTRPTGAGRQPIPGERVAAKSVLSPASYTRCCGDVVNHTLWYCGARKKEDLQFHTSWNSLWLTHDEHSRQWGQLSHLGPSGRLRVHMCSPGCRFAPCEAE